MNRKYLYIVCVLLWGACGYVSSDIASETPSIQDIQQQLGENLPDGLQNLPINASNVPSEEEAKELLKNKCERLGGAGAYERVETAQEDFKSCVMSLVNVTELQQEMEEAKPTGDLDTVFRKYCRKSPIFTDCINNFTATLDPCLEEREKESKKIVQNITESLLGFLCFKEGDRIALFIAEGGPECLQSKQEEIQHCANTTVGKYMPATEGTGGPLSQIPLLVLDEKECQSIQQFQECMVSSLEKCSEPTPANIVESLFNFVVKMTPCQNMKAYSSEPSVRTSAASTVWRMPELFFTSVLLLARFVA
ncbi:27 kDa hemolymph protein [Gryllus bimaculatus]|nr:27 kDa hemolymph protein [Gryllus bimaculatus]